MNKPNPFTRTAVRGALSSPRALAAWALLGYPALFLIFEFFQLVLPGGASLASRAAGADFRSIVIMAMPVLAVLLAAYVAPAVTAVRLISTVAFVEYALALVFGLLTLLIGLPTVFGGVNSVHGGLGALRYLVMGAAGLVLISVAAYGVLRTLYARRAV